MGNGRQGRHTVVTGTGRVARGIRTGLGPGALPLPCEFTSEAEVAAALADVAGPLGGFDQLVHTWLPEALLQRADFAAVDESTWVTACEGALEAAWWLARHARAHFAPTGGSMVFVVPTLGMSGGAGFAMLAAVAEGLRVLAKGCGRQWGAAGVTVNTVALAPHAFLPHEVAEDLQRAVSLSAAAMGRPGSVADDVAPLLRLLGHEDARFLTAATVVADGGVWMGL